MLECWAILDAAEVRLETALTAWEGATTEEAEVGIEAALMLESWAILDAAEVRLETALTT